MSLSTLHLRPLPPRGPCSPPSPRSTAPSSAASSSCSRSPALVRWSPPPRPSRRKSGAVVDADVDISSIRSLPPARRRDSASWSLSTRALDPETTCGTSVDLDQDRKTPTEGESAPTATPAAAPDVDADDAPAAPPRSSAPAPLLPVPWGFDTVAGVMSAWLLAFWSLGYIFVPGALELVGLPPRDALAPRAAAVVHLLLDVGELAATALVLWKVLKKYRPRSLGYFRADLFDYERAGGKRFSVPPWLGPVAAVVAAFPLVDVASAKAAALFPAGIWIFGNGAAYHSSSSAAAAAAAAAGETTAQGVVVGAGGASALEAAIAAGDAGTCALYLAIVALCAPLWEEAVFRGFLLPSLSKSLPPNAAVAASALAFATAHFQPSRFAPLLLLGLLFGWLYSRTRSLGAAVLAHSLWNVYIFVGLVLGRGAALGAGGVA